MGAAADSIICAPGYCGPSDAESEDCDSHEHDVITDTMIPSAIHGGEAWEQAVNIPKTTLPDIEITVTLFKTDIYIPGSAGTIKAKIQKAQNLLSEVRKGKHIDKRNPDETLTKRPEQYSIRKLIDKKLTNRSLDRGSLKSSSNDSSLEKYEFRLPPWSDTWRLKCVVAQLSGIPARDQFLVCSHMTAQSSVELNSPSTLLAELPVYSENTEKPKPIPDITSFSTSGGKVPSGKSFNTSKTRPLSPHMDLIISVPRSPRSRMNKKGPSVDFSDRSSKRGSSLCINSEYLGRGKQKEVTRDSFQHVNAESFQSVIKLRPTVDSTNQSSASAQYFQPEYSYSHEKRYSDKEKKYYSYGPVTGDSVDSDHSVQSLQESTNSERDEDEKTHELDENTEKKMDIAERVFKKMNMLTDKADLLQIMVGLTRFGCERPELAQARMFFESMNCKITGLITVNHIRYFLESPQKNENIWLTVLREVMLSQVCKV